MLTVYDKYMLTSTMATNPWSMAFDAWADGLVNGDSRDGYIYSNAAAAGSQLYPTGLSKYYDMHSTTGLLTYTFYWIWVEIQYFLLPFTLFIPIDVWLAIYNGFSLNGSWKIFIFYEPFIYLTGLLPSLVATVFRVEMEDGWGIMYN